MNFRNLLCLFTFILAGIPMFAQKIFSEGQIKYDIYLNNSDKPEGVFVISVKGNFIRREISMNSGYHNITLYNHQNGITHSLSIQGDQKYALELKPDDVRKKNERFNEATYTSLEGVKKLAGYTCQGAEINYKTGEKAKLYYTSDLTPMLESLNTMFPGLKGIPLEYEVKSSPTLLMRFVASLVDIKAIDAEIFKVPEGYKIVTPTELESAQ